MALFTCITKNGVAFTEDIVVTSDMLAQPPAEVAGQPARCTLYIKTPASGVFDTYVVGSSPADVSDALSTGPTGPQGPPGANGADGADGADGVDSVLLQGEVTLVAGTRTVSHSSITASSRVLLTRKSINGSAALGSLTYTPGSGSFVVTSVDPGTPANTKTNDVSIVSYAVTAF